MAFYLLFLITGSAVLAAAVGLLIGVAQIAQHWLHGEAVPALLLLGVALTVLLGGLTLITLDQRLVMLKPSIIYAVLGATMLPRDWVIRYLPEVARDLLPASTLARVGWGWAALMFATAAANLLLLATLPPRGAAAIFTAWLIGSKLALFAAQYAVLRPVAGRAHAARRATLEGRGALP